MAYKVVPVHAMASNGGVKVCIHTLLALALDGSK